MNDLKTVMWKEWRELRAQNADFGGAAVIITLLVLLGFVVAMAAIAGPQIIHTPLVVVISATPVFAVLGTICEAFAGERERHTLETLLASRISTGALLAGKIAVNVLYAWGGAVMLFVLLVIGANVPALGRDITLPAAGTVLSTFVLMPLLLVFLCTAGVLFSLRSPTVRQAQSKLVVFFMGCLFALLIPFLVIRSLFPELMADAKRIAATPNLAVMSLLAWCAILIVADAVLLFVARARFERERMIEVR